MTAMICGAVMLGGSFYYFGRIGPAQSYDFEIAVLLFFLLTVFARQMFARLRDDEPLQTMAYTLVRPALRALAFQFHDQDRLCHAALQHGRGDRASFTVSI